MNKETIFTIARTLLTSVGVFLIGKNFMGQQIDQSMWQMLVGVIMAVVSVVWGIMDKTIGLEMLQSFIRSAIVGLGGLLVAKGSMTPEKLESILGIVLAVLPLVYSILSRKKSDGIAEGSIAPFELKTTKSA
jgi:uncharacterized membrane protein